MKHLLAFLLVATAACAQTLPCTAPCNTGDQTLVWNTLTRHYEAYFPAGLTANFPILFYLHQRAVDPYNVLPYIEASSSEYLSSFARSNHVAIVWPISTAQDTSGCNPRCGSTNPTTPCTANTPSKKCIWYWDLDYFDSTMSFSPDDLGFIQNLLRYATTNWGASPTSRILYGCSTGGFEAELYATTYPNDILGIMDAAGTQCAQASNLSGNCSLPAPSGDVMAYIQHGDADTTIKYCGGVYNWGNGLSRVPGQDENFNQWSNGMSCSAVSPATALCANGSSNGVALKTATGCTGGKSVEEVTIIGGPHACLNSTQLQAAYEFLTQ